MVATSKRRRREEEEEEQEEEEQQQQQRRQQRQPYLRHVCSRHVIFKPKTAKNKLHEIATTIEPNKKSNGFSTLPCGVFVRLAFQCRKPPKRNGAKRNERGARGSRLVVSQEVFA